jgi:hypothetical protein
MSRVSKKLPLLRYVLCQGPFTQPDGVYFRVDVCPSEIISGRTIRLAITGSAFPETFPRHRLAWAIGCRLIELLRDPSFVASRLPSENPILVEGFTSGRTKATEEIEGYISRAAQITRAFEALRCQNHECSEVISLPNSQLQPGQKAPYEGQKLVTVNCPSCNFSVSCPANELRVLVEPLK